MNCRTTLLDVAERAHCSKSTVSLALRNDPRIPEATRQRVQACAREMNYRPDPALACIAAHRWRSRVTPSGSVVAFITTRHPHGIFLDAKALKGAREQAEQFGYRLEHFRAEDYGDPAQMARVIQHRGIRGVIMGQLMREDFLHRFPWENFCGVACNTGYYKPPLHLVMPDHSHAVKRAFHEAHQRGYRRIGLVLFNELNAIDDFDKVSAYLYCHELLQPESERIPVGHVRPSNSEDMAQWFQRHRPDCVLGLNSAIAWTLRRNGHDLPNEVAFIALMATLEDSAEAGEFNHWLTTLDHCPELLGKTALEQLDIQLRTNQQGIPSQLTTMMVEAKWNEGHSLPRRGPTPEAELVPPARSKATRRVREAASLSA